MTTVLDSYAERCAAFSREVLDSLRKAEPAPDPRNSNIARLQIHCAKGMGSSFREACGKRPDDGTPYLPERSSFEASEPYVVDGFLSVMKKLLEKAGLKEAATLDGMQPGQFRIGYNRTGTDLTDLSIACPRKSVDKLEKALLISDESLSRTCKDVALSHFKWLEKTRTAIEKRDRNSSRDSGFF